jgi:hypothetical protein
MTNFNQRSCFADGNLRSGYPEYETVPVQLLASYSERLCCNVAQINIDVSLTLIESVFIHQYILCVCVCEL